MIDREYLETIRERAKTSRIYRKFQMTGLTLAEILCDNDHKSLYIRLAKEYPENDLIILAKNIAEKKSIDNKGGYFMKVLASYAAEGKIKKLPQVAKTKNGIRKNIHDKKQKRRKVSAEKDAGF